MFDEDKLEEIESTLTTLRRNGEVVEVRIPKNKKGTVSGYFDDYSKLVTSIQKYIGVNDIYFTLNPVKPGLLSRYNNRLEEYAKQTTSDGDIEAIRYILIDLDPVRPSGISASDVEKEEALKLLYVIRDYLLDKGFPEPIISNSGNGYHLLYPVNLENCDESVNLIKTFLSTLDFLFSTDKVHVDRTTSNPSRIVKLYGTVACKGDSTDERPHRWSEVMEVPKYIKPLEKEILNAFIQSVPIDEMDKEKPKTKTNETMFDLEAWIKDHGLDIAYKAPFQDKGTKYILETCPWNADHTNRSAYIIRFNSGGIAAGCHHNSCQGENWRSLRKLLEHDYQEQNEEVEEKQSETIIRLARDCQYFKNDVEETFAAINMDNHLEVLPIRSKKFRLYLTKLYFEATGKAPASDTMEQALKVLEMKAIFSDNSRTLQRRVALENNTIYYDLCDKEWQVVKINEKGVSIDNEAPILFTRSQNMKEQVQPDLTTEPKELIELTNKHFRFKKDQDALLFAIYLVTCFIPQIAHVILVLYGEKGAAKSTTMRMVKSIVDPAMRDLLSMPTSKQDLAITLSNNYMPSFDNLDSISAEKSDLLCMAATGGAFSKRTLFTDADETILSFKRCVTMNGINVVATRADLLDRSIVLELERIPKSERKTEKEVWEEFEEDLPKLLGAIFITLSRALSTYKNVKLSQVGRMADFTYWGYAIAEVLGLGGEVFLEAYLQNQDKANEEAISSHPVAAAVQVLLRNHQSWSGSVSSLLKQLEVVAEEERINTHVKTWPKDSSVLSKRLKEVKSNLEEIGIHFDIRHAGAYKKISLERVGGEAIDGTTQPVPKNIASRTIGKVDTNNPFMRKLFEDNAN